MALGGAETVDILAALEDLRKIGRGRHQYEPRFVGGLFFGRGCLYAGGLQCAAGRGDQPRRRGQQRLFFRYGGPTGTNLTSDPDSGTVGSPSTYPEALSVASIEGQPAPYMLGNKGTEYETYAYFTNAADGNGNPQNFLDEMFKKFGDRVSKDGILEMEYVSIPGYGRSSNYIGLNVTGRLRSFRAAATSRSKRR